MNNLKPKVLYVCSGTESSVAAFIEAGCEVFSIDYNASFSPSLVADIIKIDPESLGVYDIVIFTPPCEKFSIASNNKGFWVKDPGSGIITPTNPKSDMAVAIVQAGLDIIKNQQERNPNHLYFIENPRGKMRHISIMQNYHRDELCYCKYGDVRMKPTDIWHNSKVWFPRPMCKPNHDENKVTLINGLEWVLNDNGKPDHQRAQRPINRKDKTTQAGTFGIKTYADRSRWPYQLSYDIYNAVIREMAIFQGENEI